MFESDVGGSEERGLILLEVHLLGAGDEPDVVEVAGVAEVEAAFLMGERGDVRAGDDGEADEDQQSRAAIRAMDCRCQKRRKAMRARMQRKVKRKAKDFVR